MATDPTIEQLVRALEGDVLQKLFRDGDCRSPLLRREMERRIALGDFAKAVEQATVRLTGALDPEAICALEDELSGAGLEMRRLKEAAR